MLNLWCTGCDIWKGVLLFLLFWLWKETENERITLSKRSSHSSSIESLHIFKIEARDQGRPRKLSRNKDIRIDEVNNYRKDHDYEVS
jgi:hypothetical protein